MRKLSLIINSTPIIICLILIVLLLCISLISFQSKLSIEDILPVIGLNFPKVFILSILSLVVLFRIRVLYPSLTDIEKTDLLKYCKIGLIVSIPFIFLGLAFWSEGSNYYSTIPDAAYLGDGIFKLGAPLTVILVELKILMGLVNEETFDNSLINFIQTLLTPILFSIQFCIYSIGLFITKFELNNSPSHNKR